MDFFWQGLLSSIPLACSRNPFVIFFSEFLLKAIFKNSLWPKIEAEGAKMSPKMVLLYFSQMLMIRLIFFFFLHESRGPGIQLVFVKSGFAKIVFTII